VILFAEKAGGSRKMARSDMSDLEWEFIKQVLPNNSRGVKRVDDRRVINGIFSVLRTGIPWADLPEEYGPPTTIYNRFNRWTYAGHWDQIMEAVAAAPQRRHGHGGWHVRARPSFCNHAQKKTRVVALGARAAG
jgi:transposase